MIREGESCRNLQRCPEAEGPALDPCIRGADNNVTGEWILLEEEVERLIEPSFGNPPGDQRPLGKIVGNQWLADTPDRSSLQHGTDPCDHGLQRLARLLRDNGEGILVESRYLVLGDGEDGRVDGVVVLDWK